MSLGEFTVNVDVRKNGQGLAGPPAVGEVRWTSNLPIPPDVDSNRFYVPDKPTPLATNGTVSLALVTGIAGLQYTFWVVGKDREAPFRLGPVVINAPVAATVIELTDQVSVDPTPIQSTAAEINAAIADMEAAVGEAVTARIGAETARTGAETARDGSVTARTGAETARDGSVTARTGAETAAALAADRGLLTVSHGATGTTARPTAGTVYWLGTARPANALPHDFWYSA